MSRRGVVFTAPVDPTVPAGQMVDPATSAFWASWQDNGPIEDVHVLGAAEAIAWARRRADQVLIRLGGSGSYFSAGDAPAEDLPLWPPTDAPAGGWWTSRDPVEIMGPKAGRITAKPKRVARKIDHL